jgi:hypothetical protein
MPVSDSCERKPGTFAVAKLPTSASNLSHERPVLLESVRYTQRASLKWEIAR